MPKFSKQSQDDYNFLRDFSYVICSRPANIMPDQKGIYMAFHGDLEQLQRYKEGDEDYIFMRVSDDVDYLVAEAKKNFCLIHGGCDDVYFQDDYEEILYDEP